MIICSCNRLSDAEVRRVVAAAGERPLTIGQVYTCLGCSALCGRCARTITRIMQQSPAPCAQSAGPAGRSTQSRRRPAKNADVPHQRQDCCVAEMGAPDAG